MAPNLRNYIRFTTDTLNGVVGFKKAQKEAL